MKMTFGIFITVIIILFIAYTSVISVMFFKCERLVTKTNTIVTFKTETNFYTSTNYTTVSWTNKVTIILTNKFIYTTTNYFTNYRKLVSSTTNIGG
jgi:hypothetical protein